MNHFFMLQRRHTISEAVNMQYTMGGMEREREQQERSGKDAIEPIPRCSNNITARRSSTPHARGFELPMESAWLGSSCSFCFGEGGIGGGLCLMCSEKEYRITTGFFISLVVAKADTKEEVDAMWLYLLESVCPMLQTLEEEAARLAAKTMSQPTSPRKSSRLDSVKMFSPVKTHGESRLAGRGTTSGALQGDNGSTRRYAHPETRSDHHNSRKLQQLNAMDAKRAQRIAVEEKLTEFVVLKVTALLRQEETQTASVLATGLTFKPGTEDYFRHAFDLFNEELVHSAICSLWRYKYYLGSLYLSANYLAFVSINGDRKMCFPLTAIVSMKACKGFPFTEYLRVTAHAEEYRFVDMDDIRKSVTVVERTWKKAMLAYLKKQQEVQDRYMNDFITEAVASSRPELQRSLSQPHLEKKYATHCTDNRNLFDAANSRLPWMHVNPDGTNQLTKIKSVLETQSSIYSYVEGTVAVSFTSLFFLSSDEGFSLVVPYGELKRMTLVKKDSGENQVTDMPAVIVETNQGRIHKISCDSSEGVALILQSFRAVHTGVKIVARPRDWSPEECEQWAEKQKFFADNHYLTAESAATRRLWQQYRSTHGCGPSMMRTTALQEMIHQGIPNHLRPELWQVTSGSLYRFKDADQIPYQYFLTQFRGETSEFIPEIERDLHRSLPEHPFFQSKEGIDALRNVLTALSWRNSTIGYCQGMNIVCAILLLYMSEEEVFYIMSMISETLLPEYYTKSMLGSLVDQQVIEALVATHLPHVYASLNEKVGGVGLVTVPWFMCLFVRCLPWEATLRTLDWFFAEGPRALFIVALATLNLFQREIVHEDDGAVLLELLKHRIVEEINTVELFTIAEEYAGKVSLQAIQLLRATQKPKIARELIELANQDEGDHSVGSEATTETEADTSETESASQTESDSTESESESEEIDGLPDKSKRSRLSADKPAKATLERRASATDETQHGRWSLPEYPLIEEKKEEARGSVKQKKRELPGEGSLVLPKPFEQGRSTSHPDILEEEQEAEDALGEEDKEAQRRITLQREKRREQREERRRAARKFSSNKYAPNISDELTVLKEDTFPTLLMPGRAVSQSALPDIQNPHEKEDSGRGRTRGSKRGVLKDSVAKYGAAVKPFLIRQGSSFTLEKSSREILSKRVRPDGENREPLISSAPMVVPGRGRARENYDDTLERGMSPSGIVSPHQSSPGIYDMHSPARESSQPVDSQMATPPSPAKAHEGTTPMDSPSKLARAKTYAGSSPDARTFTSPSRTEGSGPLPLDIACSQPESHTVGSPTGDGDDAGLFAGSPLQGTTLANLSSSYERSTSITAMFAFLDKADVRKASRSARRSRESAPSSAFRAKSEL